MRSRRTVSEFCWCYRNKTGELRREEKKVGRRWGEGEEEEEKGWNSSASCPAPCGVSLDVSRER